MAIKQTQQQSIPQHHSEEILVVRRSILFQNTPAWHGINKEAFNPFIHEIKQHAKFIPRGHAETNPDYKQIIPYLVFKFEDRFFVMQRKKTASEQRLANKYSLGIGGHIRQTDIQNNDIFDWSKREFEEEVSYQGNLQITSLGVLNDDTSDVGKVHLGMVMLIEGDNNNIHIKDEHKSGILMSRNECLTIAHQMETWSQLLLPLL